MKENLAVVTGGNKGIGAAIVRSLSSAGFRVAIYYVDDADAANSLAEEVQGRAYFADVSDQSSVITATRRMYQELGPASVLVNNAGIQERLPFLEMSFEQFDRMIRTNLYSVYYMTKEIVPQMLEIGSGKIINIVSQTALIGRVEMAHYTASKGGVISLTKSLAREFANRHILVNAVAPGPITSGPTLSNDEERKTYMSSIPLKRFGEPEEVAELVRYLALSAEYMTGQVLGINGGEVM